MGVPLWQWRLPDAGNGCPVAGEMPGWVSDAVKPIEGLKSVHVEIVWEPQWGMEMMSDEARLELGFM